MNEYFHPLLSTSSPVHLTSSFRIPCRLVLADERSWRTIKAWYFRDSPSWAGKNLGHPAEGSRNRFPADSGGPANSSACPGPRGRTREYIKPWVVLFPSVARTTRLFAYCSLDGISGRECCPFSKTRSRVKVMKRDIYVQVHSRCKYFLSSAYI